VNLIFYSEGNPLTQEAPMFRKIISLIVAIGLLMVALPAHADGPITLGLGTLTSMTLSPDGSRLAVGTTIGVYFYDAQTFAPQNSWSTDFSAGQLVWSPRGTVLLVIGGSDVQARAAENGAVLWASSTCSNCEWAFTPDGTRVARIAGFTTVALLEATTGNMAQTFTSDGFFAALDWQVANLSPNGHQSANGMRLAVGESGYYGGADALVYDVAHRAAPVQTWAHGAALSPDGRWLAAGSFDGTIRVYAVGNSKQPWAILRGHHDGYTRHTFAWSPDSRVLYSGAHSKVIAWDVTSGSRLRALDGFSAPVRQTAWALDGQHLFTVEGHQLVKKSAASRMPVAVAPLADEQYWVSEMLASPTGDIIAVVGAGVVLYDTQSLQRLRTLTTGGAAVLAFSPDGRWLATGGYSPFVNVWDVATGRPVKDLLGTNTPHSILALAFDASGDFLYALESNGRLRRWDVAAGTSTYVQTYMPANYYYDPAIHPQAQRVAVEYGRGGIGVSDTATGALLYMLNEHWPQNVTINSTGTRLAAVVDDTVKVWDLASGNLLTEYTEEHGQWLWYYSITDIAFSPDGAQLAVSSSKGYVRLWPVP
jgi:WD40 repeat protein